MWELRSNIWGGTFAEGSVGWLLSKHRRSGKKSESPGLVTCLPSLLFRDWNQLQIRSEHVEPTCVYKLAGAYESLWLFIHVSISTLPSCSLDVRVLSFSWVSECWNFSWFFLYFYREKIIIVIFLKKSSQHRLNCDWYLYYDFWYHFISITVRAFALTHGPIRRNILFT